jgi:hypothetical protein
MKVRDYVRASLFAKGKREREIVRDKEREVYDWRERERDRLDDNLK